MDQYGLPCIHIVMVCYLYTGTAHCANMYPECASDPPQLIQARMKIKDYIAKWLTSEHVAN